MAKRLGPFWLALSLSGCVLNPQGEDPGYEENGTDGIIGAPNAPVALPGDFAPSAPGATGGAVTPSDAQGSTDPVTGGIPNPTDPMGPGAGPFPVAPPATVDVPIPTPEPVQAAGGASAGSGGSPGAGGAGGAGPAVEPEPDAMVPGMDFDGGTFNYGQNTDGGMDDDHGDGGLIDAGVGL